MQDALYHHHVHMYKGARRGGSQTATHGSRNPDILPDKCMKIEYDKICCSTHTTSTCT
jgi:hypothetical protein